MLVNRMTFVAKWTCMDEAGAVLQPGESWTIYPQPTSLCSPPQPFGVPV